MNKIFNTILFILFGFFIVNVSAQTTDEKLADYYYNEGDCEKAIPYFEKIYPLNPSHINYERYLSCLRSVEDDKAILQLVKKQAENYPNNLDYQIELAKEYSLQNDTRRAERIHRQLINDISDNASQIISLQRAFTKVGENQLALEVLEKGRSIMKKRYPFNIQFAEVYGALNETEKMIEEYIDLLDHNPNMINTLKRIIPRTIDFDDEESERFQIFRRYLIQKIQKNPNDKVYADLLIWSLIQQKNFPAALVQAKALDKRTDKNGKEVYSLGNQASQNKDFATARKAFQYILEYGETNPYYYAAEQNLLNTRFKEITIVRNYTKEEVDLTIEEYNNALSRLPKNGKVLPIIRELAQIKAYYGHQADEAIELLNEALTYPRYDQKEEARVKVLLGDILMLNNEVWDAALLYMQVEKQFKYEPIGEEAKFKNARIFYYDGDFKFAQSQLDVLKQATSKLIANDAMNLSIFITENLGLDSNYIAMRQFAKADLLLEQHKFDEAFQIYDSIQFRFPNHQLLDNILFQKAQAHQTKGEWEKAINYLQKIVDEYPDDFLADDALYQIAIIYENHLFDSKKAADYYFQLMRDYPGSLFAADARKAYRKIN